MKLLPYVDPREDDGVPLTPQQIEKACRIGAHVVPVVALDRIGKYECVYCGTQVDVPVPLSEMVT